LDITKAFDSVSWPFFIRSYEKSRFSSDLVWYYQRAAHYFIHSDFAQWFSGEKISY
jgi:hypothetical protein